MSKGALYIISGPSGTGKGTICKELQKRKDIYLSVSMTSRNVRAGETPGVTYLYVTEEEFRETAERGDMLEWAVYSGNCYGTPKKPVDEHISKGMDVILEIEPQGALKVKEKMPEAVMIFVIPPSMEILKKRLADRGRETEEQIQERINAAKWEFSQAEKYNYIVVNDDLEECVGEVLSIMDKVRADRERVAALAADQD